MYSIGFLTILLVSVAFAKNLPIFRIIGGSVAAPVQFPYQVSIECSGKHHCGGTIIASKKILTAAHCVYRRPSSPFKVVAGTNNRLVGGRHVGVAKYDVHENYDPATTAYDIAVITLKEELPYGPNIRAADLPEMNQPIYENTIAIVSGWGAQYNNGPTTTKLNYVIVPIWSRKRCLKYVPELPTTHICAGDFHGKMNSCPGDSGGPLAIANKVIGIVSFGLGCGKSNMPAGYTDVSVFRDWIRTKANV